MTAVADALGVRRQHLSATRNKPPERRRGRSPLPDAKRIYRVRKAQCQLLQPTGSGEKRGLSGSVAVDASDTGWCSDALKTGCDNGEKARVAFALDCCDPEAIGHVAIPAASPPWTCATLWSPPSNTERDP